MRHIWIDRTDNEICLCFMSIVGELAASVSLNMDTIKKWSERGYRSNQLPRPILTTSSQPFGDSARWRLYLNSTSFPWLLPASIAISVLVLYAESWPSLSPAFFHIYFPSRAWPSSSIALSLGGRNVWRIVEIITISPVYVDSSHLLQRSPPSLTTA